MTVELADVENEVMAAAQSVASAYRAGGGCTVSLSITLRRLADAVDAWLAVVMAAGLMSDTNGFDRSAGWGQKGESNSNEQTLQANRGQASCGATSQGRGHA